jgi:hypothetical protein
VCGTAACGQPGAGSCLSHYILTRITWLVLLGLWAVLDTGSLTRGCKMVSSKEWQLRGLGVVQGVNHSQL